MKTTPLPFLVGPGVMRGTHATVLVMLGPARVKPKKRKRK